MSDADVSVNNLFSRKVDTDCDRIYIVNFSDKGVDRSKKVFSDGVDSVGADEVEDVGKSAHQFVYRCCEDFVNLCEENVKDVLK